MDYPDDLEDMSYEQEDHRHPWLWNIENNDPGGQDSGSVVTRKGCFVTFPNIIQHRADSFRLQNPTKPGHRKIVALFLVNPNVKILSSAKIPSWDEYRASRPTYGSLDVDNSSPGFPLTMDEVKEMRLKLMEERSRFDQDQTATVEDATFNLCEH